jgi:hypothetical protein
VPSASPRVIISYRRSDTAGHAGRIYDRLALALGADTVFMDIEGIGAGSDFTRAIQGAVGSSQALVAIIGREWLDTRDDEGKRRLDDAQDWVRLEIATALQRDIVVIPVLVEGARMPRERDLPPDLAGLAKRQALEISDTRFNSDVERLVAAIRNEAAGSGPQAPPSWRQPRVWVPLLGVLVVFASVALVKFRSGPSTAGGGPPVVRKFTVEPPRYIAGHIDEVAVAWDVAGGERVSIAGLGDQPPNGQRRVPAPAKDTTFSLVARNGAGEVTSQRPVDVMALGEFISVQATSPATQERITRWLSDFLRSLESIGYLPDIGAVIVVVDPQLRDNAYFDGERMVIGEPLADDRDVILREYCHRMLFGSDFNRQAMDVDALTAIEYALADYLPASSQDDPRIGEVAGPVVWNVPFVRTLINAKKFDQVPPGASPHVAGEPWAGAFWDLRLALGRSVVDPLLLEAWFSTPPRGRNPAADFAQRLIHLAETGGGPAHATRVRSILRQRRFPDQ